MVNLCGLAKASRATEIVLRSLYIEKEDFKDEILSVYMWKNKKKQRKKKSKYTESF